MGLTAAATYVAPGFLTISSARASSSATAPSKSSVPTPPTPPTAPSNVDDLEFDEAKSDNCEVPTGRGQTDQVTISRNDMRRASEAVAEGYAKPLNEIWPDIVANYPGRIIKVEFTGFRWRPRYRLRAISKSGHLETVIVSARTGLIERIVGC